ncbi:hypothetical protein D3C75_961680 [compost metagenome]
MHIPEADSPGLIAPGSGTGELLTFLFPGVNRLMQSIQPLWRKSQSIIAKQDKQVSLCLCHIDTDCAAGKLLRAGIPGMLHTVLDDRLERHFQHFHFHISIVYI